MTDHEKLQAALRQLRAWTSRGPCFWPKEDAIQGWFCAALRESHFASHAMNVVQEVHFGEALIGIPGAPDPLARAALALHVANKRERGHVRFDVVVLSDWANEHSRNLESHPAAPRLVAEVKALNSAGGLTPADLVPDLRKLRAAKLYIDQKFGPNECVPLLLIVATAGKDSDSARAAVKFRALARWVEQHSAGTGDDDAPTVLIELLLHTEGVVAPSC